MIYCQPFLKMSQKLLIISTSNCWCFIVLLISTLASTTVKPLVSLVLLLISKVYQKGWSKILWKI